MKKSCCKCGELYTPTERQTIQYWWICRPCLYAFNRFHYNRRKALGFKVSGSKTWDAAKRAAWREFYYKQPYVRKKQAENARIRRQTEQLKHAARVAVRYAIRRGEIVKPLACQECGGPKVQAHHLDYGQPLLIRWLCRACHDLQHHQKAKGAL